MLDVAEPDHLAILKAARARISDKKNWTSGFAARDKNSRGVQPESPKACKWCATGAIIAEYCERGIPGKRWWLTTKVLILPSLYSLIYINDHQGHKAVLDVFDRTIASLEVLGTREKIRYTE